MARFFFNVHDGKDLPDRQGVELADGMKPIVRRSSRRAKW
jgi:hypothetical protein